MSEQELQELKDKVERLDKMHNIAFAIIVIVGGVYAIKSLMN